MEKEDMSLPLVTIIQIVIFAIIFIVGIVGNTLVIYVVVRYSKMQTVTNMYIVNLAIADECFLLGVPVLITTMVYGQFIFGAIACKIYYISSSVNQFTSSILVLIISIDRYIAVCHSNSSSKWRTPLISKTLSVLAWTSSVLLMIPIIKYANILVTPDKKNHCVIEWVNYEPLSNISVSSNNITNGTLAYPKNISDPEFSMHNVTANMMSNVTSTMDGESEFLYTIYLCFTAFVIPFSLILVFYCLIIRKLFKVGPAKKSKGKEKSNRKVTKLVMTVIAVYVVCGLPYWLNQIFVELVNSNKKPNKAFRVYFLFAYCLNYANPAINPVIYAFLSDNFRKSFVKAFACVAPFEVNAFLQEDKSVFPIKKLFMGKSIVAAPLDRDTALEVSDADSSVCRRSSVAAELLNKKPDVENCDPSNIESTSL